MRKPPDLFGPFKPTKSRAQMTPQEKRKDTLTGILALVGLVVGFVCTLWIERPMQEHVGPWLGTLSAGQRATIGAVTGLAAVLPLLLPLHPRAGYRTVRVLLGYLILVWVLWAVPWAHRGPGGGAEHLYASQADWALVTSAVTFLAGAVAGVSWVLRVHDRRYKQWWDEVGQAQWLKDVEELNQQARKKAHAAKKAKAAKKSLG